MKAILLSAGFGKRLAHFTKNFPKVMVPVNGKPCLQHNIEHFKNQGVDEFLINTHYLPEKIKKHFKDGSQFGVKIKYSYESKILGTAGSLNKFRDKLKDTFLVVYGDILSDINIGDALKIHKKNKAEATLILDRKRAQTGKGVVVINKERVISFIEKPTKKIQGALISSGVYILEPSILERIPNGFSDFGKDILPDLVKEGKVFCSEHKGYIFDIGTVDDLKKAEQFLKSRQN